MFDPSEKCGCGEPLHYTDPSAEKSVRRLIALNGPFITVEVQGSDHAFRVPRHFIALHGLKAADLEMLADLYSWERV